MWMCFSGYWGYLNDERCSFSYPCTLAAKTMCVFFTVWRVCEWRGWYRYPHIQQGEHDVWTLCIWWKVCTERERETAYFCYKCTQGSKQNVYICILQGVEDTWTETGALSATPIPRVATTHTVSAAPGKSPQTQTRSECWESPVRGRKTERF